MPIDNKTNNENAPREIKRFLAGTDNGVHLLANGIYDVEWYIPLQDGTYCTCTGQIDIRDRATIYSNASIPGSVFEKFAVIKRFPGTFSTEMGGSIPASEVKVNMLRGELLQTKQVIFAISPTIYSLVSEIRISMQTLAVCVDNSACPANDNSYQVTFDSFECAIEQFDEITNFATDTDKSSKRHNDSASISIGEELPIPDLMNSWIGPLQVLCSLVANRIELIEWVLVHGKMSGLPCAFQIVGEAIMNQPTPAQSRKIRMLPQGAISLNEIKTLLMNWQKKEDHPIVKSYGRLALQKKELIRSRFLLFVQTLEGEYNFLHSKEEDQHNIKYKEEKKSLMKKLKEIIDKNEYIFLDKNLPRKSFKHTAAEKLRQLCADTFPEIENQLAENSLIKKDIFKGNSPKLFGAVTAIRNDISHGSEEYEGPDFLELTNVLEIWCRCMLFDTLGASKATITKMLDY